jgi:hypothetical protein
MIQEQFVALWGDRWGGKVRTGLDPARYASKDGIAYLEDDDTVSVWDWQRGQPREIILKPESEPNYPHLPKSEATFIKREAVDHLNLVEDREEPDPDPERTLEERVQHLEEVIAQIRDIMKGFAEHIQDELGD